MPVAPWSGGPVETVAEDALTHAERIGYPADDQGGRRRRRTRHPPRGLGRRRCAAALSKRARRGARGLRRRRVLLEKLIEPARHVEVQVIADGHGDGVGRRRARLPRAAPQPEGDRGVGQHRRSPPSQERELREAAVAARASSRTTATPARSSSSTSPRPRPALVHGGQHPAAGRAPGHRGDDRRWTWSSSSSHVAAGGRLEGEPPPARGHAIEARLNAEDPALGFAPAPGLDRAAAAVHAGPACGSTPASPRGTSSRPSSTR